MDGTVMIGQIGWCVPAGACHLPPLSRSAVAGLLPKVDLPVFSIEPSVLETDIFLAVVAAVCPEE